MSYAPNTRLVFSQQPAKDGRLVFGESDAPQSATATISLALTLPPLRIALTLGYDNQVTRDPAPVLRQALQPANRAGAGLIQLAGVSPILSVSADEQLGVAAVVDCGLVASVSRMDRAGRISAPAASRAIAFAAIKRLALQAALPARQSRASVYQSAESVSASLAHAWQAAYRYRLNNTARWQRADALRRSASTLLHPGLPSKPKTTLDFQYAMRPRPGRRWIDPGIVVPAPVCYTPSAKLVFKSLAATDARLVFVCENAVDPLTPKKIVPVRRAYIVINDVSLRRADGAAVLRAPSLNLGIDADSWNWSWDAQIDAKQLDAVMPDASGEQVELIARINGAEFRLLTEKISRDRSFEKRSLKISGRGVAAGLAAPYWPARGMSNESDRTMQQLGLDALTINGVSSGWGLDWQAADWLVPAGLWACVGTPIDGLLRLAEAAGAYVQADPRTQTLHVLPRYKVAPWDFASTAPDLQLPESVFVTDSIEWLDKTAYNAVYVSGDAAGGVLGRLKRAGTAGDVLATMITDALCTHADAVTARGLPVLADTGRQEMVTGTLQVLPESGIVSVGSLVQIGSGSSARRGLVRGVKISAGLPKLRQTLEIECHG